ncbi:MAG TPA: hypothetical protein EYP53_03145 [Candidatus Latescibacteria bacterium]|nr:hypothetical protein [Candidatus Latescibacterota bacterium]
MRIKTFVLVEDVLIILSIFALWPTVLGWKGDIFKFIQYFAFGALVIIFIRRIGRMKAVGRGCGPKGQG